jgi:RNA polymerase sigma-70 factor (ECF subfamily)
MENHGASVNELAKACARSTDAVEWEELVRHCAPLASLMALRACRMWTNAPSPAMVDDIVQEIFLKLCEQERRILREFEPRGEDSFLGLLRVISVSVANDYFRRRSSAKRGGKVVTSQLAEDGAGMAVASHSEAGQMERSALLAQLDRKLQSAPEAIGERDRTLFWLYYRHGFTAEEIARLAASGLTAKGVESAVRRVAVWLRAEVQGQRPRSFAESG